MDVIFQFDKPKEPINNWPLYSPLGYISFKLASVTLKGLDLLFTSEKKAEKLSDNMSTPGAATCVKTQTILKPK